MNPTLTLEHTVYAKKQFPDLDTVQIPLAGRSNVGKSSLINCLAGRSNKLAKISSTPGKTRSINYYRVTPGDFHLVDLPGYGYARCSKAERQQWAQLIEHYLTNTPSISTIIILLDSRHTPQKIDLELTTFATNIGLTILPVLTKADKCKQKDHADRKKEWKALLPTALPPILFSSKTKQGRDPLWQAIYKTITDKG